MGFFIKINVCHNKTEADQRSYFFWELFCPFGTTMYYCSTYLFHVKEEPIEVTNGLADGTDVFFLGV